MNPVNETRQSRAPVVSPTSIDNDKSPVDEYKKTQEREDRQSGTGSKQNGERSDGVETEHLQTQNTKKPGETTINPVATAAAWHAHQLHAQGVQTHSPSGWAPPPVLYFDPGWVTSEDECDEGPKYRWFCSTENCPRRGEKFEKIRYLFSMFG
ncbi:hypothetical protein BDV96DRAFT_607045 [Lophiotrema nucula]|uniref:Uncharacterized protein n=1 Tax=Lophiotrema nucula TaxID=690887 RepID=A0A6A5YJ63_9PLEO|nr:hypothetical protein BDV96DRAFT_607045 [Lophiotrema nucula]